MATLSANSARLPEPTSSNGAATEKKDASKPRTADVDGLASSLQKALPFLPGHNFEFEKQRLPHFRKSHAFDFRNKVPVFNGEAPGIGSKPLPGQDTTKLYTSVEVYPHSNGQSESVPAWIAFDRKVLRYYAYFQESIQEKREEQNRIRRVNIYFYLEDDTIHVSEPKTNNSGIPQGTLIRRHRIPRPDLSNGQHYIVSDLSVGRSITFYGREFVIVGCDEFTRKFMSSLGFHMDSNRAFPVDQYESYRYDLLSRMKPTRPYQRQLQLKKFLENDRQVLRFFCVWDDSNSMFGDMRRMVIHYFLSDDTIEIREIIQPNSGKDANTSLFLRRCRLPKRLMPIRIDGTGSTAPAGPAGLTECDPDEYYTERDFKIGAVIHLYGRPFVICDCDGFTREYYHEKYGLQDFDPVCIEDYDRDAKAYAQGYYEEDATWDINETADDVNIGHNYVYNSTAPHKVAMAAEDGANAASQQRGGSGKKTAVPIWSHVVIPEHNTKKLDFQKMMRYDGVVLRFSGQLQSKKQIDRDRRFVISVFMADDSVSIFEPPQRNSGIVGGKFLEKCRIKKPGANVLEDVEQDYYSPSDFHVGAEMEFNRHPFIITGADDYTMKFMNDHPELFPKHHQSK